MAQNLAYKHRRNAFMFYGYCFVFFLLSFIALHFGEAELIMQFWNVVFILFFGGGFVAHWWAYLAYDES